VLVVVFVLVLDTDGLKSFEDEHEHEDEDEDETANEFIGNCVSLTQFLFRSYWQLAARCGTHMKHFFKR